LDPKSSGHIFLSYRSIEADFALRLAADLKNAGVCIWMDRLDGIRGGDEWRRRIEEALTEKACVAMIAVVSPDYCKAEYCRKELARANRLRIPVFPALIRSVPEADWPLEIEGFQYIDFCAWPDESAYRTSTGQLLTLIRETSAGQVGEIPDAETRYLTSLLAELEANKGVFEYIELAAQTDAPQAIRPEPGLQDRWAPGFSVLLAGAGAGGDREEVRMESIQEAAEMHPRFVLLGAPGAGKTTTLRRLARDAVQRRLEEPRTAPLPLLLRLATWKDGHSIDEFVREAWPFYSDPAGLLKQGDVLLYLDGLNEMGGGARYKSDQLREWLHFDNTLRVVVTCRADDYEHRAEDRRDSGRALNLSLPIVSVDPLDAARITRFAESYLGSERASSLLSRVLPPDTLSPSELRLWASRSLFELARNPYFLTAFIYLHDRAPEGDLPRNTGRLFRMLTRALWERESALNAPGWVPLDQMEVGLAALAFAMIDEDRAQDVSMTYAVEKVGNDGLLRAAHGASLLAIRGDEVRFSHQLMQEYFAAVHLARLPLAGHIEEPRLYWHTRRGHIAGKWDQVIIALSGLVDADPVVSYIAEVNPLLAGDCIASGVNVSTETRAAVQARLVEGLTVYGCMTWASASVLAEFADRSVVPQMLRVFAEQDVRWRSWVQDGYVERGRKVADALLAALQRIGADAVPDLLAGLASPEVCIRHAAARALGRIRSEQAVPALARLLTDGDMGMYFVTPVRDEAAEALSQIATPEALKAVAGPRTAVSRPSGSRRRRH